MQVTQKVLISFIVVAAAISAAGQTVPSGPFRVGAAKVDITPTASELPKQDLGVLDKLYARAIVIDNGHTSAALITLDAGAIPTPLWKNVSERMEKELGIPAVNVLITATHTHSAPMAMGSRPPAPAGQQPGAAPNPFAPCRSIKSTRTRSFLPQKRQKTHCNRLESATAPACLT